MATLYNTIPDVMEIFAEENSGMDQFSVIFRGNVMFLSAQ